MPSYSVAEAGLGARASDFASYVFLRTHPGRLPFHLIHQERVNVDSVPLVLAELLG